MKLTAVVLGCVATGCATLAAQELRWLTEFRRVGPDGEIVLPDRAGKPREVLSPAVVRNGFSSFHLVVSAPPGKPYDLYFGANPEGFVRHTVYREVWRKEAAGWIPDALEEVKLPLQGLLPPPGGPMGQTVDVYFVDLFVPPATPLRRLRVEAQLHVAGDWIISPLELRLQTAQLPLMGPLTGTLAPLGAVSATTAYRMLRGFVCSKPEPLEAAGLTIRAALRRNAAQDIALAKTLESKPAAKGQVRTMLAAALEADPPEVQCAKPYAPPASYDPEAYSKVRDYLFRLALE